MKVEELPMTATAATKLIPPITSRDHIRGPASAAVTLVEYGDYACTDCNKARLVVKQLHAILRDRLRFVFRNYPMLTLHSNPHRAAEAAEAAGMQNKFWEMHDILYDHQTVLSDKHLKAYATQVGLDMERFNRDMLLHTCVFRVAEDILSASQSGVSATPAFFINGSWHSGPCDLETLLSQMEEAS
jgi:protein-disulfide isomerase